MTSTETIPEVEQLRRILNTLGTLPFTSIVRPPTTRQFFVSEYGTLDVLAEWLEEYASYAVQAVREAQDTSEELERIRRDVVGVRRLLGVET